MKHFRRKIRGKWWTIEVVPALDPRLDLRNKPHKRAWGACMYGSRTIVIRAGQDTLNLIDTVVHEVTHAVLRDAPEGAVDEIGRVSRRILRGLRRFG